MACGWGCVFVGGRGARTRTRACVGAYVCGCGSAAYWALGLSRRGLMVVGGCGGEMVETAGLCALEASLDHHATLLGSRFVVRA